MDTRLIETTCFLCGSPASTSEHPRLGFLFNNCCQCGELHLSHSFIDKCEAAGGPALRHKIAALATEWRLNGLPQLVITDRDSSKDLSNRKVTIMPYKKFCHTYPRGREEMHDRILKNLANLLDAPESATTMVFDRFIPLGVFFASGATPFEVVNRIIANVVEMEKLGYLDFERCQVNVIDSRKGRMDYLFGVAIAKKGWDRLADIAHIRPTRPRFQAFVSMWNDRSRDLVYEKGIKPAIEAAHAPGHLVQPHRLDFHPVDRESAEQIFSEIRSSAYLVADITGYPPGVFHEAGFAQGIGVPVIWIIDRRFRRPKSDDTRPAIDTRKFDHIAYDSPSDLADKLLRRIQSSIGLEFGENG